MKRSGWSLLFGLVLGLFPVAATAQGGGAPPDGAAMMQRQMSIMTPELRARIQALSPETRATLRQIFGAHTRLSETATLRQVMVEILSDLQGVVAGLAMGNGEQAALAARAVANHRIPRGGILPYLAPEQVNDDLVSSLSTFNAQVEGNALHLAEAAEAGDLSRAAGYLEEISLGCIGCHDLFRGRPGVSPRVLPRE